MSAASMAAIRSPINPAGRSWLRNIGMAPSVFAPTWVAVRSASAAMPQIPGIRNRQTKKKLVPV